LAIGYRSYSGRSRISSSIRNYEEAIKLINLKHNALVEKSLDRKCLRTRQIKQFEFLAAQAVGINLRITSCKYYLKSFLLKPRFKSLLGTLISLINPMLLIKIRSSL